MEDINLTAGADRIVLVVYLLVAVRDLQERVKRLEERERRPVRLASATSSLL